MTRVFSAADLSAHQEAIWHADHDTLGHQDLAWALRIAAPIAVVMVVAIAVVGGAVLIATAAL